MAYNSYFPVGYQPTYQQYQPQVQQVQQPAQQQAGINWVQGESGAKSFWVGAGQSALLMDSESNSFYIKSCDASGMPLPLRIFDYKERTVQQAGILTHEEEKHAETPELDLSQFVTWEGLEERLTQIAPKKKESKKNE